MVFRLVIGALALAGGLSAAALPAAAQQPLPAPAVAVIDIKAILRDSKAGKSLMPQIAAVNKDLLDAERSAVQEFRAKEKTLMDQRTLLAPEAFSQRQQQLREEANTKRKTLNQRKDDVQEMVDTARNQVLGVLQQITIELAKERKLNLVLLKSHVFIVSNALDITGLAMARLDQKLPSVKLEKAKPKPKK